MDQSAHHEGGFPRTCRYRDAQTARRAARDRNQAFPYGGSGEIDRVDTRTPAQEGPGRSHLGTRTEESDVDIVQVQPVRVVQDQVKCGTERRLGNTVRHPSVHLATQIRSEESTSAIRNG